MVVRASPVLGGRPGRAEVPLVALLAGLALWEAFAGELPSQGDRWDVALTALVLIPATFGVVWLLLPLSGTPRAVAWTAIAAAVAIALGVIGAGGLFNVAKLVTYALVGFCFLLLFETLAWVVLVSVIIPWVDIVSVYHGPTKVVVEEQPGLFDHVAVSFALPGEDASANLGPPDVLFFALFLASAKRFELRVGASWIGMTSLLSLTLVATYAFDLNGLPALPAVCAGFLLPNADLLFDRWRTARTA